MVMKDSKQRLFEVMGRLDKTFKPKLNEEFTEPAPNNYKIGDYEFYKQEHVDGERQPYTQYYIQYGEYSGYLKKVEGDNVEVEWDTAPGNWEEVDDVVNMNYADIVNNAPQI